MEWQTYIKPELLILIPVLHLIGAGLKKSRLADKWIPLLLGGCGVLLAALYVLADEPIRGGGNLAAAAFTAVTQGVLVAGASVYLHQILHQLKKEE